MLIRLTDTFVPSYEGSFLLVNDGVMSYLLIITTQAKDITEILVRDLCALLGAMCMLRSHDMFIKPTRRLSQ